MQEENKRERIREREERKRVASEKNAQKKSKEEYVRSVCSCVR